MKLQLVDEYINEVNNPNSSRLYDYDKLKEIYFNAVVIIDGDWLTIKSIRKNYFTVASSRLKRRYDAFLTLHLIPYGKGIVKRGSEEWPLFIYDTKKKRTDVPKAKSTKIRSFDATNRRELEQSVLTGSIVQVGTTQMGGYIYDDIGDGVYVAMKNGESRLFYKKFLHYVRYHKSPNGTEVIWFRFDDTMPLLYTQSNNRYDNLAKYKEFLKAYDSNWETTDDWRISKKQRDIINNLRHYYANMKSTDKKIALRLNKKLNYNINLE